VSDGFSATQFDAVFEAPAWMPLYERVVLYGLTVGLRPRRVLEIGTYQGGSTLIMCAALDDLGGGHITCVDPAPRLASPTWEAIRHRAEIIARPSPGAIAEALAAAGEPFDLALIDGDHTRDAVERDIDATIQVLADAAYILFHDAHHQPVREAIDAALGRHAGRLVDAGLVSRGGTVDENGSRWGGLRLLRFQR
jgi:predicted O-methyltransferase YrrM